MRSLVTLWNNLGLKSMNGQNFPKIDELCQIVFIKDPSLQLESYFMRYLAFQNKIVKNIKSDTNKILIS
jgi:hypothetical protein